MTIAPGLQREAARQQWLLRSLWRDAQDEGEPWLRDAQARQQRGLHAYRVNAAACAERALASAFPTVQALVGEENFAPLARDFWRLHPPERGDLGEWGGALPAFIAASAALASEPYLADSARLDWLLHLASRAADGPDGPPDLSLLASGEAGALRLVLRPGTALLASHWPVAAIWAAHQAMHPGESAAPAERFAAVREAMQAGQGEQAFVWREGYAVRVVALETPDGDFTASLLAGASLASALDAAGAGFSFEAWLLRALRSAWLLSVVSIESCP